MFFRHNEFKNMCVEVQAIQERAADIRIYGMFWSLDGDTPVQVKQNAVRISIDKENITQWKKCVDNESNLTDDMIWIDIND